MRIELSKDKELVKQIDQGLQDNFNKYGKRYCPCSIVQNDDTVCMCKDFIENAKQGESCHCEKFIKVEE